MIRFKIKKIKFSRILFWQFGIIAFLIAFAVVLFLNIYLFAELKKEIAAEAVGVEFSPKIIEEDLLESAVGIIDEKRSAFEKNLLKRPQIKDPSL